MYPYKKGNEYGIQFNEIPFIDNKEEFDKLEHFKYIKPTPKLEQFLFTATVEEIQNKIKEILDTPGYRF